MLSDRDLDRLNRALDRRRLAERDIEFRQFVRPDGRDVAIMKARESGVEFAVASPGYTFKPGTSAPTGSKTGRPGELLLPVPAIGQRGQANFPPIVTGVTLPPALADLVWTSPGDITFTNGSPAFIDVDGVGEGFEVGMSVQIVNQTTPGQFTVSAIVINSSTSISFRVTDNEGGPSTAQGDLRLVTSVDSLDVEEFVFAETI